MKESKEKFNLPQFKVVVLGKEGNSVYICDGDQPVASLYWHGTKKTFGYANFIETAPKMYTLLKQLHGVLAKVPLLQDEIQKLLKKARGEF